MRLHFEILTGEPPCLKDKTKWSKEFQELVTSCLQKEPEKRPPSADLLEHQFFKKIDETSKEKYSRLLKQYSKYAARKNR